MSRRPQLDPRSVPAYSPGEVARYLRVPAPTIRNWIRGRSYRTSEGDQHSGPLSVPVSSEIELSFYNLIELHMVSAFRRLHGVSMQRVRRALAYLRETYGDEPYPFAARSFQTDGVSLFLREADRLIDIGMRGQLAIREIVESYARRVEWDEAGRAKRLFPYTREGLDDPRIVAMDPRIAAGRPMVRGVPTAVIAERSRAGESLLELSDDYDLEVLEVEEALRCEEPKAA